MTGIVHVITDLGPTDEPDGVVVPAQLLGVHVNGYRIFYYDPFADDQPPRHTNHPCNPTPHP